MAKANTAKSNDDDSKQPSRVGKKAVITYLSPEVHKRLKILAAERDTTLQALTEEAIGLLFDHKVQSGKSDRGARG